MFTVGYCAASHGRSDGIQVLSRCLPPDSSVFGRFVTWFSRFAQLFSIALALIDIINFMFTNGGSFLSVVNDDVVVNTEE